MYLRIPKIIGLLSGYNAKKVTLVSHLCPEYVLF